MASDDASGLETAPVVTPRRRLSFGSIPFTSVAVVSAVALLITEGVAISLASSGSPAAATVIAGLLLWLTVISFVLGVIALVRGPHRGWAIAAMIVSVIANPLILLTVLSFFGGL